MCERFPCLLEGHNVEWHNVECTLKVQQEIRVIKFVFQGEVGKCFMYKLSSWKVNKNCQAKM